MAGELSVKSGEDGQKMAKELLKLTGWLISEHIQFDCSNEIKHEQKSKIHNIDALMEYDNPLNDRFKDVILISSKHHYNDYGSGRKTLINNAVKDLAKCLECADLSSKLNSQINKTSRIKRFFGLLIFLSSSELENNYDLISELYEDIKVPQNEFEAIFILDNYRVTFLLSAYHTALSYRPDAKLKYLYQHTGSNQDPEQLYLTGSLLPIELINSSIIPIVLESNDKISLLLFCDNSFEEETLKRLIWLVCKLGGLSNEMIIYLPNYDLTKNESIEKSIKQAFKDIDLINKVHVKRFNNYSLIKLKEENLHNDPIRPKVRKNDYGENVVKIENTIDKILPFGEMLKPLLSSSQLSEGDLKKFLHRKGILYKENNKDSIISLMGNMLFSPDEINDLRSMVHEKEDRLKSISRYSNYTGSSSELMQCIIEFNNNLSAIEPELNCRLIENNTFISKGNDRYELELKIERTKANKDLITGITNHELRVTVYVEKGKVFLKTEYTAQETKKYAEKIITKLNSNLRNNGIISTDAKSITFGDFESNSLRIDFLMTFYKLKSIIFSNPDIENIKFRPDPSIENIPPDLAKMKNKVTNLDIHGNDLGTLDYLEEDEYKCCILLERIIIKYDFEFDKDKGICIAEIGFPSTLNNKSSVDFGSEFETSIKIPNIKINKKLKLSSGRMQNALSRKLDELVVLKYEEFNSRIMAKY